MPILPVTDAARIQRLTPPTGRVRVVLDTDAFNEIDDQFAIVYALLAPERLQVEALYAAPFHNQRASGPGDGMRKSYQEILRLLQRLNHPANGFVHLGSERFLPDEGYVDSAAAQDLANRARTASPENPLYVAAIGAITNVASALLSAPDIVDRLVVVWLGGHAHHWPHTKEFNLRQDVRAARTVLDSGVALVHIPCLPVTSHLQTTVPELDRHVRGQGAIGDYLADIAQAYMGTDPGQSRVIWDMSTIAWLLNPEWVPTVLIHSPILNDGLTWSVDRSRHHIRSATLVHRDPIFQDFFARLAARSAVS